MSLSQKLVCSGDLYEFLLSRMRGDGPRPTDCSPFIRFCYFASNLADSTMPQYAASIKETFFFSSSFYTCLSSQAYSTNIMGVGFKCHDSSIFHVVTKVEHVCEGPLTKHRLFGNQVDQSLFFLIVPILHDTVLQ